MPRLSLNLQPDEQLYSSVIAASAMALQWEVPLSGSGVGKMPDETCQPGAVKERLFRVGSEA